MEMKKMFEGAGVALITPFNNDYSVDYESLGNIINLLIEKDVDYLVLLGSTGEAATISRDEKVEIVKFAVNVVDKRVPLVVGCTSNSTDDAVENIKLFSKFDIDGILSASPYYNKPSQEGIYQHFKEISLSTILPIIIYNVPYRTGSNILPQTCIRLANDFENIVAIKEASGSIDQISAILATKPDDFMVISGDDSLTVPIMAIGAVGAISVAGNCFPALYSNMVHYAQKGDFDVAKRIFFSMRNFIYLIFQEGNPSGIKAAMNYSGLCDNVLRKPLLPVSHELYDMIKYEIDKYRLL